MSTNAENIIDDQTTEDHTISVTSLGEAEQVPAGHTRDEQSQDDQFHEQPVQTGPYGDDQFRAEEVTDDRGPLADDGEPIFPPSGSEQSQVDGDTGVQQSQDWDGDVGQHRESDDAVQSQQQEQVTDTVLPQSTSGDPGYDQTDVVAAAPVEEPASVPVSEPAPASEPVAASEPAHKTTSDDDAWLALKGRFVDDPAAAVQEAADRVEKQLADVRSALSSADTEELRTAFRRYRDLSDSLR